MCSRQAQEALGSSPAIICVFCAVLETNMQTLMLTELFRGMGLTLKYFFDRKVTVSIQPFSPRNQAKDL